ncbi:hypothetical protein [Candidatus Villigracilis proximus]|uniref:3-phosphoshikimate 1-carboxyvinyltransferase n=1 Tax=Candidatus Villigracilis proximus TaxID=3140683 RepID=UPI0031E88FB8
MDIHVSLFSSSYSPITSYPIESDASAASYFFAAPAICGGTVKVENISRKSVQGDVAFVDVLKQMGCTVEENDNSILVTRNSSLHGVDVDMRDIPDTAQTLAAVAPFADSPTRIRGIASARVKETDRVHATCVELDRLGVRVEEHEDGMTIHPVEKMRPAVIQTYNDHRMAMAFSLIGLRFDGVTIENPSCVSKHSRTSLKFLKICAHRDRVTGNNELSTWFDRIPTGSLAFTQYSHRCPQSPRTAWRLFAFSHFP